MFIDIPAKPKVQHGEFPFELVYEYKEVQTVLISSILRRISPYNVCLLCLGGNEKSPFQETPSLVYCLYLDIYSHIFLK